MGKNVIIIIIIIIIITHFIKIRVARLHKVVFI